MIKSEITTSTTSMTSIPKPLKFMIPHYAAIKEFYTKLDINNKFKLVLADLLAILVIVTPNATETSLFYVMLGTKTDITSWGQEFIK
jgi:26S proteasome regulatory subunit N1